ncbi:MAG: hypothetical protein A2Y65_10245 [Deltaproteobacteria bacterium RBG_13_52_11]|nr:MAG: hypothetical protein A2Y65_10245 [Deltaproteobacteria bacterium RBG_13_52_11]
MDHAPDEQDDGYQQAINYSAKKYHRYLGCHIGKIKPPRDPSAEGKDHGLREGIESDNTPR